MIGGHRQGHEVSRGRGKEGERGRVWHDLSIGVEARSGEDGKEGRIWGV